MTSTQNSQASASLPASEARKLAIEITGLSKIYWDRKAGTQKQALNSIDLAVPQGSIFGLLGPNGAGKSTLINILAGLVVKSSGQAKIMGIDIDAHPRRARLAIGVVPQELNFDAFFTPREVLELQAGLFGVRPPDRTTDQILDAVGLSDKADAYARSLSGGMRRRMLVAKALVHHPPVVILDEPTAGVDIELRRQLWQHMRSLNNDGVTIILTTHYLEEAEEMCDRIAIIDQGSVVAVDEKQSLLARLDEKRLTITVANPPETLQPTLRDAGFALDPDRRLSVHYRPSQAQVGSLLELVRAAGLTVIDLETTEADLEELFVRLTSKQT